MFCKNCGVALDEDAQFCENCGTIINLTNQNSSQISVVEENDEIKEHADVGVADTINAEPDVVVPPKKKKFSKIIMVVIVAVIAIVVALFIVLGNNSDSKKGNLYQEVNFNNGAKFAYDSTRLYIVGPYNDDDEETSLYSTDYKGVNKKLISDDPTIFGIRLVDNKIYYKTIADDEYSIGVINTDGSENSVIVTTSESFGHYDVYDDTLYYLYNSKIHTCTLTGENDTTIIESVDTFTLCNGYIYYVDSDDVIGSYCIKNAKTKEFCKSAGAHSLAVAGNTLYFACDTGLSSLAINGDGTITKIIRDDSLDDYVFYDDCIYYIQRMTSDEGNAIAEEYADTSSEKLDYLLILFGTGYLYKADMTGGDGELVDSDQVFLYSLFTYPDGLYCKNTALLDDIEHIELN